jgi:hypothetical protein
VVDQLAEEYAGRPVVFLEYIYSAAPQSRLGRFWSAYGGGSAYFPMVIVDSGDQVSSGPVNYRKVYKGMVDASLARPARADLQAHWHRSGDRVNFTVQMTNLSGVTLSSYTNEAALHAIVYEDAHAGVTDRMVRTVAYTSIDQALAPGSTATYTLETPALSGVVWEKLHFLVLADFRPSDYLAPYDMLQAAIALP